MSRHLPIEIVREMLRIAAEDFLVTDRSTVMNIALAATLGYGVATPVLYRTLSFDKQIKTLVLRIFDDGASNKPAKSRNEFGIVRDPPARRLCPLVRRLFVNHCSDVSPMALKKLVNLERFFSYEALSSSDELKILEALPPSVTLLGVMQQTELHFVAPSMTHISYCFKIHFEMDEQPLHDLLMQPAASAVTHIILDVPEVEASCLDDLKSMVRMALLRKETTVLALHVLGDAAQPDVQKILLKAMRQVVQSEEDTQRLVLWFDPRLNESEGVGDYKLCQEDVMLGRNAWTEGRPIAHFEKEEE